MAIKQLPTSAMNTKAKSNLALAAAIEHFSRKGYFLFLPVGDNGGLVDLIVSADGSNMERVQCKYTAKRRANCPRELYEVSLAMNGRSGTRYYTATDFDILYVGTPLGNYLFQWARFCDSNGRPPKAILLGPKHATYKLN